MASGTPSLGAFLPAVGGEHWISGVAPGAETFGTAEDMAAYQMLNNAGVDSRAISAIWSSQPFLTEATTFMAEIFSENADPADKQMFLMTFGSGPQAIVKVANALKSAADQWGQLMFLMRAGGNVRKNAYDAFFRGTGPGKNLARLVGDGGDVNQVAANIPALNSARKRIRGR